MRWYQERTRRDQEVPGAHQEVTKREHDGDRYQEGARAHKEGPGGTRIPSIIS